MVLKTRLLLSMPDGLRLGGVYVWSTSTARALRARGLDAVVVDHPRPGAAGRLAPDDAYRRDGDVLQTGPTLSTFQLSGREVAFFRRAAPAVVIPNYAVDVYQVCARILRDGPTPLRIISFLHSDHPDYYAEHAYFEPIIHRFVAVSQTCAEGLYRALPPARHADVIMRPYPVAAPRSPRPPRGAATPLRLLYAGRLDLRQKRILDLPPLMAALRERGCPVTLTVAGDGPDRAALVAALAAEGIAADFRGAVPHDEMTALYHEHDVFLLPTRYEGTSIALLEACVHGVVPVVTDVSGMRGVLADGSSGFILPEGDVPAMVSAVSTLAAAPARLAQMATAAAAVAGRYDPDAYADWLAALVETVALEPLRPWPAARPVLKPNPELDGWRRRVAGLPGLFALKQRLFGGRRVL